MFLSTTSALVEYKTNPPPQNPLPYPNSHDALTIYTIYIRYTVDNYVN